MQRAEVVLGRLRKAMAATEFPDEVVRRCGDAWFITHPTLGMVGVRAPADEIDLTEQVRYAVGCFREWAAETTPPESQSSGPRTKCH